MLPKNIEITIKKNKEILKLNNIAIIKYDLRISNHVVIS